MKKIITLIFLVLLVFLGYFFFIRKTGANHQPIIPIFSAQNQTYSNLVEERLAEKLPFNLLLLGYGGGSHDGAYLTDSLIVARIDPLTRTATLISIPRDLWVHIPTDSQAGSFGKINSAYAIGVDDTSYPAKPDKYKGPQGAGNMAMDVVDSTTGLTIDRFLAVDFSGFVQFIDTLGGVDITLDKPLDDYAYPVDGQEDAMCGKTWDTMTDQEKSSPLDLLPTVFPCRFEHIHFDAGHNHLDGTIALKFVRSRHSVTDGTDFGRSNRQRQLISAVVKKTLSLAALPKALSLYQTLKSHLDTDLSASELASVVSHYGDLKQYQIKNIALTDQNTLMDSNSPDGQFILAPTQGPNNWDSLHQWLNDQLYPPASPSASPR